jgi:hypothetical protein
LQIENKFKKKNINKYSLPQESFVIGTSEQTKIKGRKGKCGCKVVKNLSSDL